MATDDAQHDSVLKTMAFTRVGDLLVLCHSSASPSDQEWNSWLERTRGNQHRGMLALTEGGSPNSAQRARVAEIVLTQEQPPPFVLLTDSTVMRSVMTAFLWLIGSKQPMKALAPSALDEALTWMGVTVSPDRVHAAIARLQLALKVSATTKSRR